MLGCARTGLDCRASLKINSSVTGTMELLISKLGIRGEDCLGRGRPCTPAEHRGMLGWVMQQGGEAGHSVHGHMLRARPLPAPAPRAEGGAEDAAAVLGVKVSYLHLLVTASRRTLVLTEADTSQVFFSGSVCAPGVLGAKVPAHIMSHLISHIRDPNSDKLSNVPLCVPAVRHE